MPTSATKLASYGGTLKIETIDYEVEKWNGKLIQELIEVTNMASGGWREHISGLKSMEGSFDFKWDTELNGTGTLPAPFTDADVSLELVIGAKKFNFEAKLENINIEADVNGAFSGSCDYKSNGAVTYGNVA